MKPIHTAIVHPGTFHADDSFAATCLRLLVPNVKVLRKEPEPEELDDPEIAVIDVGGRYDPATNCFDHHQPVDSIGDRVVRPQHIHERPMAAFGLVWETYGANIVKNLAPDINPAEAIEVAIRVKCAIVLHVDAEDNGMRSSTYSVSQIISRINGDAGTPDENFGEAMATATQILRREILAHVRNVSFQHVVTDAIANAKTGIIKMDAFLPWKRMASSNPDILFAIYPSNREGWVVECCPPIGNFMGQKLPMPMWTIHNQKMRNEHRIIFAHNKRFLVVCETEEAAENLAATIIAEPASLSS